MARFEERSFETRNERGSGRGRDSGRSGGRSSRDGGRSSRDGGRSNSRGSGEMHSAICDECGSKCELPFKPTSGKPILCSDCFRKAGPKRSGTSSNIDLSEINAKLDKILELLTE